MVVLVFAVNLKIQAMVMRNQTRAAVIPDKIKLSKIFHQAAWGLFGTGILLLLAALFFLHSRILSGYWIPGCITIFLFASTLIVWGEKLTARDQNKLGQRLGTTSTILIVVAVIILLLGIIKAGAEVGAEGKVQVLDLSLGRDFMMALFIGSTSFAGLIAVVIGQVIKSNHNRKIAIRNSLANSFAAGIIAAAFSFAWFLEQNGFLQLFAVIAFFVQLILCWSGAWTFWRIQ